ncbi:polyprenol phosphomannose-dependent alpha 1,6 mannosyltransferase MptB [Corynebacterium lizhenjunii]|uniref:Polyprenol phosphomannose-dependent alpha 1,6 mannosyltransferase MptB n=1 Tax=Corynebacterium lizhenjunii TaxID=2709394 RepID=A0A7T0PAV5_9CORY|nr:polyprenol phosphomannose-dependent alpha 1,6 mannosyltransferase MptB [Corynebacterium lizhenjunii]QPK80323.1 polyprenol phosphomannose-dependent alpha 1,6 mannosyltransferase MptB [Corynebacterium lizhenjunii]
MGAPGSRSSELHGPVGGDPERFDLLTTGTGLGPAADHSTIAQLRHFFALRWMGTAGALFIACGGWGAGALPVVDNPYDRTLVGSVLGRMLQASSALVFIGIGLLVLAWVGMAPFLGHRLPFRAKTSSAHPAPRQRLVTAGLMWRTWAGWVLPLLFTAPLFTQDIYSYLANGSLIVGGGDPYAGGPVEMLGAEHPLARSVPFIWANSPSPYGPVSLGWAALISWVTQDSTFWGVLAHRVLSVAGIIAAGWGIGRLACRCRVAPATALWLGILNPLALLHLVGGIHNEALMLGMVLMGMEWALRGIDKLGAQSWGTLMREVLPWCAGSAVLISCAGMVKVTGFIGLGFTGMALARALYLRRGWRSWRAVLAVGVFQVLALALSIGIVTVVTGIGLGWITNQGGAATIRSWMSISNNIGVGAGYLGMVLGLGDHTDAMLVLTRYVCVSIAGLFMLRMLLATYRGAIHPIGGLGVSTLVLVLLFPVIHPWYMLWAVFPLAPWANRHFFRSVVVGYSAFMSFSVLPRGMGLPPSTVAAIYGLALAGFILVAGTWLVLLRRAGVRVLH